MTGATLMPIEPSDLIRNIRRARAPTSNPFVLSSDRPP